MKIYDNIPTSLDLNGPILGFTQNPTGVGSTGVGIGSEGGGSVTLVGIATTSFPTPASNTGYVTYRWYEQGVGALSDSTYVTGTATTALTLSNLITPTDNQRKFYVEADYVPSAYGTPATPGDPIIAGTARSTGNAINEPLNSGIGTITVDPLIEIIGQPTSIQSEINTDATLTLDAGLTDSWFEGDVSYQWLLNGEDVTDGTVTTITETTAAKTGPVEETYTSDGSHTVPSAATGVQVILAGGRGGTGGRDAGGPGGRGGQGRIGTLTLTTGKERKLEFKIGRRGNDGSSGNRNAFGSGGSSNVASGGRGGGAGQNGWSGGGGGGGGATGVRDTNLGSNYIGIAGGGGGGGGGSWNRGAPNAYNTQSRVGFGFGGGTTPDLVPARSGSDGSTKNGDGGGGGGGAGGANIPHPSSGGPSGGSGGSAGQDNSHGGNPGYAGVSGYDNTEASFASGTGTLNDGDGYAVLKYTGTTQERVLRTRNTIVSGSTTKTLTIRCDTVGLQTAQCRVSYENMPQIKLNNEKITAANNSVLSDFVNYVTLSAADQYNVNVESIGVTDSATISSINLFNGDYTFEVEGTDVDNNGINQFYSFYSPDRDLNVEMDLYGGRGNSHINIVGPQASAQMLGGEGGYSRIRFTMTQNTEYVIAGLIASVNTPFLYRKAALMACVGQGGDAGIGPMGSRWFGGRGGGIGIAGEKGSNRSFGGPVISAGGLSENGKFGSKFSPPYFPYPGDVQGTQGEAGQTISCTKGIYWAQQGKGACEDLGNVKFRLRDGTEVTNTSALITRGFKAGYNIMQTGGWGSLSAGGAIGGGDGGNGATGGQGSHWGGGGGGSGYQDGSVTVVSTMQGGSTGDAKVILRVVT